MLKKIFKHDFVVMIIRLLPLYAVLMVTQVVFYFYNKDILGGITGPELGRLLCGSLRFDTSSILYLNCVFIVLSAIPFKFRWKDWYQRMLFWIYTVTNTLGIIVLNLADVVYFRYTFKRITLEELHFFREDDNNGELILDFMLENWYLVIVGLLLIAFIVFAYRKVQFRKSTESKPVLFYPVNSLLFCLAVYIWVGGVRGSFDFRVRPYTVANAVHYTKSAAQTSLILSNPYCVIRTARVSDFKVLRYFEDDEAEALFSPYHYPDSTYNSCIGKKNVVLLVLEGFSREHSQYLKPHLNKDGGYTPFLDSLMREGYTFRNAFANGMKSIEALPSLISSIPSYRSSFSLLPQALADLEGMPYALGKEGYSSHFFCGAHENQMGFEDYCKLNGMEHFYDRTHFEMENDDLSMANSWGIWDMPWLQYMAHQLDTIKTPFFATVFTLTSHHPYILPEEYEYLLGRGTTPMHHGVLYTDLSIKKFFETASKMDWFENTLFVFTADHVSPQMAHEETMTAKGNTEIILFMYTPDGSLKGSTDEVFQQLDIMPTVLGLVGNKQPYFAFGRDIFNEKDRFKMATNCVHQVYQCITDSYSLYSDGEKILHVYAANDTLQKNDIKCDTNPEILDIERHFKAILQSYTKHVHDKDYIVPRK